MANRYVRIHNKPADFGEPGTILGFSMSASLREPELEEFTDYFDTQNQQLRELDHTNEQDRELVAAIGGVSAQYIEVQPPIAGDQLTALGQLCAQHIDPSHNAGFLIDDRSTESPLRPYDARGTLVAQW